MDAELIESLKTDLVEQLRLYQELMALNRDQMQILEGGAMADTDAMVAFVGKKQNAMQRLEALDAALSPKKEAWKADREAAQESDRQEIDNLIDQIADTIRQLIAMEDEAQARLESLMTANSASVDNIRKKSQVNRAYAAYGAKKPMPRYFDQKADDA